MIDYDVIALARGQKVLYYRQFGSYQGEWVLLSKDDESYYVYKGYYGSCSGCDAIQAEFDYDDNLPLDSPKVQNFIKDYPPEVIIPHLTAWKFAKPNNFGQLLPANIRDQYSDISWSDVEEQCNLLVKGYEKDIEAREVLQIDNQEARREIAELYGLEKFMVDLGGEVIDSNNGNQLIKVKENKQDKEDFLFLILKDSSTQRHYMLRVPPNITKVKDGLAWSFDVEEYRPILET